MPEDDSGKGKSGFLAFWTTLPGILTGVAAVVTAFVGLATFLRSTESAAVATTSRVTQPAALTAAPAGGGVLSHGRLSLRSGDQTDLETGVIGTSSGTDLSFGPESTPWLHAGADAFFAPVAATPTRAGCAAALTRLQARR